MLLKKFKNLFVIIYFFVINFIFLSLSNIKVKNNLNNITPEKQINDVINNDIINNDVINDNVINNDVKNTFNYISNALDYIAIIQIPKISLEKRLYPKNSVNNNVNKNIQILKESNMPDVANSNLILASHSGSSKVAYFNDLPLLEIGDDISIIYNNIKYFYNVFKIIEVEKDGHIDINLNNHDKYLTLITCKVGTNKQIVVISKLINEKSINYLF